MQLQRDRLWAQNHQFGCVTFDSSKLLTFMSESLKNLISVSGRHSSFQNCTFYLNWPWCWPDSAIWVSLQNCICFIKFTKSVSPLVFHVPTNRFSTQHNGHLHRLKLSWSIYPDSLSGLYFKSYSRHQNHQNFSSSAKTNNNNTVPIISQAPPNRFTLNHVCICIGLSSLD